MSDIVGNHTSDAAAHLRVCFEIREGGTSSDEVSTHCDDGVNDVDALLVVAREP